MIFIRWIVIMISKPTPDSILIQQPAFGIEYNQFHSHRFLLQMLFDSTNIQNHLNSSGILQNKI
jgi:hypothetical protein